MMALHYNTTKAKELIRSVQEITQTQDEVDKVVKELPEELASVKQLIGDEYSPTIGKKLIKAGTFLAVAVPEPFISDLTGTVLIATGIALDKLGKKDSVRDVYKNLHGTLQEIETFRKKVSLI